MFFILTFPIIHSSIIILWFIMSTFPFHFYDFQSHETRMLGFEPSVAVHLVLWYLSKLWLYCIRCTWWSYYWWITARCYIHPPCSHRFHCSAFQYCKLTNGQFGICCDRSKHLLALNIYLIVNDQNSKLTVLCTSYWQYLFLGCFTQIIISIIGFVNC